MLFTILWLLFAFAPASGDRPPQASSLMGQVGFKEMTISGIIVGLEPHERINPQDIIVDLKVSLDLSQVAQSDNLASTVDYVKLADTAKTVAITGEYLFIDVMALDILKRVFERFPSVEEASIKIQKPAAIPEAKSGGLVELSLTRKQIQNEATPVFGKVGFDNLRIRTIIGDLQEERENAQNLFADLRVTIDLLPVAKSHAAESTVSYVELAQLLDSVANEGKYFMFESLAVDYLNQIQKQYPQIEVATICIRKPGTLPTYPFKNDAIVMLTLTKSDLRNADERVGLRINDMKLFHQGEWRNLTINIDWASDSKSGKIDAELVKAHVKDFVAKYPDPKDFWEVMNKKLVRSLVQSFSAMNSVDSVLSLAPDRVLSFPRKSTVRYERTRHALKESFEFTKLNYLICNESFQSLDLKVAFELKDNALPSDYPDYQWIDEAMREFFMANPISLTKWEALKPKLENAILKRFSSMTSLTIEVSVAR